MLHRSFQLYHRKQKFLLAPLKSCIGQFTKNLDTLLLMVIVGDGCSDFSNILTMINPYDFSKMWIMLVIISQ